MKRGFYLVLFAILLFSCNQQKQKPELPLLSVEAFTDTIDGSPVSLYTLKSGNGIIMQVTNFGGRVVSLWVPDKNGAYEDVVIGFDNIKDYKLKKNRTIGPVVGRFANRIAKGQFELDGVKYQLPINNNGNTLHSGPEGFDQKVWNVDKVTDNEIRMSYVSPDGEEGFPGTLTVKMVYSLTRDNEFKIAYEATTDKPTIVNLSHHGLFNLKGHGNGTIEDNLLTLNASKITVVDSLLIPTGEIAPVVGTPFYFRNPMVIGSRIKDENEQLRYGKGYDHNWVLDHRVPSEVELVGSLYEPVSGRLMEIWTDQPGVQIFSGNYQGSKGMGKYGKEIKPREVIAIETQKYPDSPNHSDFPSTRLNPGQTYKHTCIYKFLLQ